MSIEQKIGFLKHKLDGISLKNHFKLNINLFKVFIFPLCRLGAILSPQLHRSITSFRFESLSNPWLTYRELSKSCSIFNAWWPKLNYGNNQSINLKLKYKLETTSCLLILIKFEVLKDQEHLKKQLMDFTLLRLKFFQKT